jgi:hypothetical protein
MYETVGSLCARTAPAQAVAASLNARSAESWRHDRPHPSEENHFRRNRLMKFATERPYADPGKAARKLIEIANCKG